MYLKYLEALAWHGVGGWVLWTNHSHLDFCDRCKLLVLYPIFCSRHIHNPFAPSTLFDVVGGNLEQMLQWRSRSNSSGWPSSFCDSSEFKNVPKAKKFQKQSSTPRVPRKNWNIEGVIEKHSSSNSYYSARWIRHHLPSLCLNRHSFKTYQKRKWPKVPKVFQLQTALHLWCFSG